MRTQSEKPNRLHRSGLTAVLVTAAAWIAACAAPAADTEDGQPVEEHAEGFVEMDSAAVAAVDLQVATVTPVAETMLSATGTIIYDQNRVSQVGPRAEGRVVRIEADLGHRVRAGAALAVLESPDLAEAEAAHEQARVELDLARENFEREQSLFEKGISSRKEMVEARTEFLTKEAAFRAATARHRTLGAVDHPDDSASIGGLYTLSAPISGTVVERAIVQGQIVGPEDDLFTVADLTNLWIVLDIYDRDLTRVREGLEVEIRTAAFRDHAYDGVLTYVGQVVDPTTRTVKARVEISNPDRTLRPGMFATALIRGLESNGVLAVPGEAIQEMDGGSIVFVPAGTGRFEIRDVVVGSALDDGLVTIVGGLAPGDSVVSQGSFYLKSELLKESFGGDEH